LFVDLLISEYYSDLWKFDGEEWVWVSGPNYTSNLGIYGVKGVPSSDNFPGARAAAASWMDNSGNMWMFGGQGYPANIYDQIPGKTIHVNC
jgi:hypothetical protein